MIHLRSDPDLGSIVDIHEPLSLDPADDLFERLIVSLLRQQVSMASAAANRERLSDTAEAGRSATDGGSPASGWARRTWRTAW